MKTRNLTRCALASALIAVCAWITIPASIPFTMQTFGVFLMLGILGGKLGSASIGIYLLLGIVGLPVFSGFRGGFGTLLGSTGGYLVGFLVAGGIYWLLEKLNCPQFPAMLLAMAGCYAFGTGWFWLIFVGGKSLWTMLTTCVIPFLIPDGIKISLAWYLSRRMKPYLI